MATPIKVSDVNKTKFYQLPKSFFHNPIYKKMKNESKLAYSILKDLLDLSIQNNWVNEHQEVYVKLSRAKLMDYLNIKGTQKFAQIMKELEDKELIVYKKLGLNQCNEIYICMPDELDTIYSDDELLEKEPSNPVKSRRFENQTSGGLKIKPLEVRKSNFKRFENQTYNKTNYNKTNINKTNYNNNIGKNNINSENVVVDKDIKLLKIYLDSNNFNINFSNKDLKAIANALIEKHKCIDSTSVKVICNIIQASTKPIKNIVGFILSAIENNYEKQNYIPVKNKKDENLLNNLNKRIEEKNKLRFCDYEQRKYDYDVLEKKLLGWCDED